MNIDSHNKCHSLINVPSIVSKNTKPEILIYIPSFVNYFIPIILELLAKKVCSKTVDAFATSDDVHQDPVIYKTNTSQKADLAKHSQKKRNQNTEKNQTSARSKQT